MTPDELLTEVVAIGTGFYPEDLIDVIGAVINLHTPEGTTEKQCAHDFKIWPCPTIQAIENGLL